MFGLDVKGGSITFYRCNSFRHILQEGPVYELNGLIPRSNPTFKFADAAVSIKFTDHTAFVEVTDTTKLILNPEGELQVPQYE
ncbi:hypothetical protein IGI04_035422 [Brassica rapa subsp. trilocularis]|uniref:B30.2/SPRY domain-containing protein n=1 Tax=Brassica rapa subsp. trilocularis TaxID=1813537 RepID=A0ABQ7LCI2_BRACM|nr:hypothetical protein IGI04_035422 [Brassica rapa subsp. trilocularis]